MYICFVVWCYSIDQHNIMFDTSTNMNPCNRIHTCIPGFPFSSTSSRSLLAMSPLALFLRKHQTSLQEL